MQHLLAVDPGEVHVGCALFEFDNGTDPRCTGAWETDPVEFREFLRKTIGYYARVVVEEFRLYPHLARTLTGSDMPTSQLIGVIRWLCGDADTPCNLIPAGAKRGARGLVDARDISLMALAKKAGGHALDAELIGWTWFLKGATDA